MSMCVSRWIDREMERYRYKDREIQILIQIEIMIYRNRCRHIDRDMKI